VEAGLPPDRDAKVDLGAVEQHARSRMWNLAAQHAWPGISVKQDSSLPAGGSIKRLPLGAGELFEVESFPADVVYCPASSPSPCSIFISVMVQVEGLTHIHQSGRQANVEPGDVCFLDEARKFRILTSEWGRILFLRLPRAQSISRHPLLDRLFGRKLPSSDAGTRFLADLLMRLGRETQQLDEAQRQAALGGAIQMLGLARPPEDTPLPGNWRIVRAIEYIEQNLIRQELSPEIVARDQRISRRRLDEIMQQQIGRSISRQIWHRRLERAAEDLHNSSGTDKPIAQVAFANGFENAAHFARAFKHRYHTTPGQWRLAGSKVLSV
jgi:AraC family transcriptional activator of tynA and feaB